MLKSQVYARNVDCWFLVVGWDRIRGFRAVFLQENKLFREIRVKKNKGAVKKPLDFIRYSCQSKGLISGVKFPNQCNSPHFHYKNNLIDIKHERD